MLKVSSTLFGVENNPKPRSNISAAWSHFSRKKNAASAICNYCRTDIAVPSGSTSGMFSHLQRVHPAIYEQEIIMKKERLKFLDSFNYGNLYPDGLQVAAHPPQLQHEEEQNIEEEEVQIKANDVYHLPKTIYPELLSVYKNLPNQKIYNDITGYDVVIHCQDGILSSHKLILGSASPFMRSIFTWRDVDHLFLGDFKKCSVTPLVEALYTGNAETLSVESQQLAVILGIALAGGDQNIEDSSNIAVEEEGIADIEDNLEETADNIEEGMDEHDGNTESTLIIKEEEGEILATDTTEAGEELILGTADHEMSSLDQESIEITPEDGNFQEIDATVLRLKNQIYEECARNNVAVELPHRSSPRKSTRTPSKIWNWFVKDSTVLKCLVCNAELRNCGNTTNAAFHLKKHPFHYQQFKKETEAQQNLYSKNVIQVQRPIARTNIIVPKELPLIAPRPSPSNQVQKQPTVSSQKQLLAAKQPLQASSVAAAIVSTAPIAARVISAAPVVSSDSQNLRKFNDPPKKVLLPRRDKPYEAPKLKSFESPKAGKGINRASEQFVAIKKFVKILPKPSSSNEATKDDHNQIQDGAQTSNDDYSQA